MARKISAKADGGRGGSSDLHLDDLAHPEDADAEQDDHDGDQDPAEGVVYIGLR